MFPTRDIVLRFEPTIDPQRRADLLADAGLAVVDRGFGGLPNAVRARLETYDGARVIEAANRLAALEAVRFAEPDFVFTGRADLRQTAPPPADPLFRQQWHHQNTGALYQGTPGLVGFDVNTLGAWAETTGDAGVIAVVLDTGVAPHPDLPPTLGADFTDDPIETGAPFNACDRHGTAVAGLIGAIAGNLRGGAGVAPGVTLASARTFTSTGACDGTWTARSSQTVRALEWARQIGARVTVNANSYGFQSAAVADAYDAARDAGLVHFASAGNDGAAGLSFPASLGSVLAIGATAPDGSRAPFSNTGPGLAGSTLAFVAPGVALPTTDRPGAAGYENGDSVLFTGTSAAAPVAAGVAALLLSRHPQFTPDHLAQRLRDTARDLGAPGDEPAFGAGQPDAGAALTLGPCSLADLTGEGVLDGVPDGRVTLSDFSAYLVLWSFADPRADITPDNACDPGAPDGAVTLSDVSCFLAAWSAGCP